METTETSTSRTATTLTTGAWLVLVRLVKSQMGRVWTPPQGSGRPARCNDAGEPRASVRFEIGGYSDAHIQGKHDRVRA